MHTTIRTIGGMDELLMGDHVIVRFRIPNFNADFILKDCLENPLHPSNIYTPFNDTGYLYTFNSSPIARTFPGAVYSIESIVRDVTNSRRPIGLYYVDDELTCCFNHGYVDGTAIRNIIYNRGIRPISKIIRPNLPNPFDKIMNCIAGPIAVIHSAQYMFGYAVSDTTHRLEFSTSPAISSRDTIGRIISVVGNTFDRPHIPVRFVVPCDNGRFNQTSFCEKIVKTGDTVDITVYDSIISNSLSNVINNIPIDIIKQKASTAPESIVYISILNCKNQPIVVSGMRMDSSLIQTKNGAKLANITCLLTDGGAYYSVSVRNDALYKNLQLMLCEPPFNR